MLEKSLETKVNFHICHQIFLIYDKTSEYKCYKNYSAVNNLCNNIKINLESKYYRNNLPKLVKQILYEITNKIDIIFGFGNEMALQCVIEFFLFEQILEYKNLMIKLKTIYDQIK